MADTFRVFRRSCRAPALILLLACVAGCATSAKRQEADLAELLAWLPGRYDNAEQVKSDAAAGRTTPHLELAIVPVRVPRIGDFVFYVHETAGGDEARVLSQRLWSFEIGRDGILHSIWSLAEPNRWRAGHTSPDLFKSVMPQDVQLLQGCQLRWERVGEQFEGANEAETCRVSSSGTGSVVQWSLRMELTPTSLAIADQLYDLSGQLVQGRRDEPFYRFRKR